MRAFLLSLLAAAAIIGGETFVDAGTGFTWPEKLADKAVFAGDKQYDDKALGYSVRYADRDGGAKIDIYLYDMGRQDIGDGNSKAIKDLHAAFAGELAMVVKSGRYLSCQADDALSKALQQRAGERFSVSVFDIQYPQREDGSAGPLMKSVVMLTAVKGRILKVRCSYTAAGDPSPWLIEAMVKIAQGLRQPAAAAKPGP